MQNNTKTVCHLLRGIADALEENRCNFADYEMYDNIHPHQARETEIEVTISGLDPEVLLNDE